MDSENLVQQKIRILAGYCGATLMRNNSGAATDQTGRLIRYGLGNDSAQLNQVVKSSDLIGFTELTIQARHIGKKMAIFTAIEVKATGWQYRPADKRAVAQRAFIDIINNAGGLAGFAQCEDDLKRILIC